MERSNINSNYVDGTIQNYVDNAMIQQATYQSTGANAEVSAGGVLVKLDHTGFPAGHYDGFQSGWNGHYWEPMRKVLG